MRVILFHSNLSDQIEMVMFLKNVSIAGGSASTGMPPRQTRGART